MTVEEAIAALQKIENKKLELRIYNPEFGFFQKLAKPEVVITQVDYCSDDEPEEFVAM